MDFMALLQQIFELCIIPLLGILTKFAVDFLIAKRNELNTKVDNEVAQKYTDMVLETVTKCVIATNQTYVNSLKDANAFDETAQKEAFDKTMNAVLAILSEDAKEYIIEATGDINVYLTQLIEAEVNKNRKSATETAPIVVS